MLQRSLLLSPEQRSELIQLRRLFISKLSSIIEQRKEIYTLLTVSHMLAAALQALHCKAQKKGLCQITPMLLPHGCQAAVAVLHELVYMLYCQIPAASIQDVSPASSAT